MKPKKRPWARTAQVIFFLLGFSLVLGSIAALRNGRLSFHTMPGSPIGYVFAPTGLIVGGLLMIVAFQIGKKW